MTFVRPLLVAAATLALPAGNEPAPSETLGKKANVTAVSMTAVRASTLTSMVLFRGMPLRTPPGIRVLSPSTLLLGGLAVEVPEDVMVEFNEHGEAVFSLAKNSPRRAWVLTVGKKKIVASASARTVVPLPGTGDPRVEWSPFAYMVPPPNDSLRRARDLEDPYDASPFD
jgi:hypothetical protein